MDGPATGIRPAPGAVGEGEGQDGGGIFDVGLDSGGEADYDGNKPVWFGWLLALQLYHAGLFFWPCAPAKILAPPPGAAAADC